MQSKPNPTPSSIVQALLDDITRFEEVITPAAAAVDVAYEAYQARQQTAR